MDLQITHSLVLAAIFELLQADRAVTRPRLSAPTGLSPERLLRALAELEVNGWVDREELRLTLPGLAVAVAVQGRATARRMAA